MNTLRTPDTTRLLEVLVRLHDDIRQIQYPYSAKVRKWGAISESELEDALELDPDASEKSVWSGLKTQEVASRISGAATNFLDQEGFRERWTDLGMSETSWQAFIREYVWLRPDSTPIRSDEYFRLVENENLLMLAKIFDREVVSHISSDDGNLSACLKTKWWENCHSVFSNAVSEAVFRKLKLDDRPNPVCYTPEWNDDVRNEVTKIAKRWRDAPIWKMTNGVDPGSTVDFATNNAARVKELLKKHGFTTFYLEGRT